MGNDRIRHAVPGVHGRDPFGFGELLAAITLGFDMHCGNDVVQR